MRFRLLLASWLLKAGMALLPKETQDLVRDLLMFHVPGALTVERKLEILRMKSATEL
jgi:hypothetical protein